MRSEAKDTGSATGGSADPLVAVVGERIPCRDAKRRVWQALDLLQTCRSKPQTVAATLKPGLSRDRRRVL
jgi:hypothetical protein